MTTEYLNDTLDKLEASENEDCSQLLAAFLDIKQAHLRESALQSVTYLARLSQNITVN